ncbi:unnamed protein product [Lactuca virosa]|uniref:Uncharacterized protein n=1 Tax=Lactuca virosa TaxID=75947 RepID=A0AAU9MXG0_9ASTR|nr:unnamed protein product [Lactuca virosa]
MSVAQPLFSLPTINDASPLLQSVAAPIPSASAVVGFDCGAFVFGSSCIADIFCSRPILSPVPPSPPEAKLSWSLIDNTALASETPAPQQPPSSPSSFPAATCTALLHTRSNRHRRLLRSGLIGF